MVPNKILQMNMCYCECYDKSKKLKSKNEKHLKSLAHQYYEKFIRTNHTIENPIFFEVDNKFIECITNQIKF